eukprot:TRINITY_DN38149_c0_g1_i1.p1 TRINITY_DN38149_c0_g1~~TRINITY_DN38149_c0_g1_i1.p1  ORF type:complete len:769 (+),score=119.96 TRINITY_DN38149_c0_g1_i1:81-2387(+)
MPRLHGMETASFADHSDVDPPWRSDDGLSWNAPGEGDSQRRKLVSVSDYEPALAQNNSCPRTVAQSCVADKEVPSDTASDIFGAALSTALAKMQSQLLVEHWRAAEKQASDLRNGIDTLRREVAYLRNKAASSLQEGNEVVEKEGPYEDQKVVYEFAVSDCIRCSSLNASNHDNFSMQVQNKSFSNGNGTDKVAASAVADMSTPSSLDVHSSKTGECSVGESDQASHAHDREQKEHFESDAIGFDCIEPIPITRASLSKKLTTILCDEARGPSHAPKESEHRRADKQLITRNVLDHEDCGNSDGMSPRRSTRRSQRPTGTPGITDKNLAPVEDETSQQRLRRMKSKFMLCVDAVMTTTVLTNAVSIGVSSDVAWDMWPVIDLIFFFIFAGDFTLKLCVYGMRGYWLGPDWRWNWFEAALLAQAALELGMAETFENDNGVGHGALRLIRLCRIARLLRLCRLKICAEPLMMINGTIGGIGTLLWSTLLLMFPLFCIAMVLKEALAPSVDAPNAEEIGAASFSNLGSTFFILFRCLVQGDCTDNSGRPIFLLLSDYHGVGFSVCYIAVVVFMNFGLFNVIVAIYVENTVVAAHYHVKNQKLARLTNNRRTSILMRELVSVVYAAAAGDVDPADVEVESVLEKANLIMIKPEVFDTLVGNGQFIRLLRDLDVGEDDFHDLFDTLDTDASGSVDLEEMVSGIVKLRGDARRSDMIQGILLMRSLQDQLGKLGAHIVKREEKLLTLFGLLFKHGTNVMSDANFAKSVALAMAP